MKRPLCMLLVLLLFFAFPAGAESPLYLLWDIPFGIPALEVCPIVLEEQGIHLTHFSLNFWSWSRNGEDSFQFLGCPVTDVTMDSRRLEPGRTDDAAFLYENMELRLAGPEGSFDPFVSDQSLREATNAFLAQYDALLDALIAKYGPPTQVHAEIYHFDPADDAQTIVYDDAHARLTPDLLVGKIRAGKASIADFGFHADGTPRFATGSGSVWYNTFLNNICLTGHFDLYHYSYDAEYVLLFMDQPMTQARYDLMWE